jgi:hypothetical protein
MSGIETIKIIVDAEKEAAKILADAQARTIAIRKTLGSLIEKQREETIRAAKREAEALVQNAESSSDAEAQDFEKHEKENIHQVIANAISKKEAAIEKLVGLVTEMNA